MSDYTIKKLSETKDSAPGFGFAEMGEAHFATDEVDAIDTGVSLHVLNPNQRQPFGHKHDKAEEIYVIIAGSGRMKLDDEVIEVTKLDAIRVAPPLMRAFESGEEGLQYVAFGPRHEGDGELVPGWWSD